MKEEDLYDALKEHKAEILGDKLEVLWKQHSRYKKFALHVALLKLFGWELLGLGVLKLFNDLLHLIILPVAIAGLVSYFQNPPSISKRQALTHAGVLIGYSFVAQLISHSSMMAVMHICMKMRVSCTSMIYKKSLRMSKTSLAQTTVGQIVNLLSNDVGPFQTALATYMLYRSLNTAALYGITFLIMFVPLQIYIGRKISLLRLKTALRTDERIRLMNEILSGIQVIKMYTWEKPFAQLIAVARRREIKTIRTRFILAALMLSLEVFLTRTSIFISFIIFVMAGYNLTAKTAFTVTAIYNFLKPSMTMLFSISVMSWAEVHISVCRIQTFLCYEEQSATKGNVCSTLIQNSLDKAREILPRPPKISITKLSANWAKTTSDNTLSDINLSITDNELVAVVGPVGSGKSSLFNVILGELPVEQGGKQIQGRISYASQEPWIFSATIRQNILFGDDYDRERYDTIINVCALESDLRMLPYGDKTVVGDKGNSLSGGQKARINLARSIYKEADIYLLDDPLSAVDSKVGKHLFQKCIKQFLRDKMCILITHQLQYLKETDKIIILSEGRIVEEGSYSELQTSSMDFAKLLQEFNSNDEQTLKDKTLQTSQTPSRRDSKILDLDLLDQQREEEKLVTGAITTSTYLNYLKAGRNWLFACLVISGFLISQVAVNAGEYYVAYWVNLEQRLEECESNITIDRNEIIYVYSGLTALTIFLGIIHTVLFFFFVMRVSVNLHNTVFKTISHATMRFFNNTPAGRILNRFSNDLGTVDDYLPFVFVDFLEITLTLFGCIALATSVNVWFILPSCVMLIIFYFLRCIFLYTSRSVKRIEGITRSPVFNHLTASINGLATIRAFSAQNTLIMEFNRHQDHHSAAWYLFISASRAFGFWSDFICNIFVSCIIISFLYLNNGYYGGDIGLVMTQFLGLNGILQWGMRQWNELENNMTSVERVLEYNEIQKEPTRSDNVQVPEEWPKLGKITFQNVSMKYSTDTVNVLIDLNFDIYPGEKIGIVGRTGAGKTSTISALFQLYEIEGSIVIDDVDTTKIPLELLRSKLSIIPQEPVLFTGTIRTNLDPFDDYTDEILWNALEQVELKDFIQESFKGLGTNVNENGANFSVGQRQLLCLARAITRSNKILIMDEATANVDPYTDGLIQNTIKRNFSECTVLTIAHRLNTVMDSDKVLVIDAGKVIEFDHPFNLLKKPNTLFYTMVKTTGKGSFENLYSIAEKRNVTKGEKLKVLLPHYKPHGYVCDKRLKALFIQEKKFVHKNDVCKDGKIKIVVYDEGAILIEIVLVLQNSNMETDYKTPKKKKNFGENVNPCSALFFLHMFPVFQRNYKKGFREADLCDVLNEQKASMLGDKLQNLWKESYSINNKYLLHKLLFHMFGFRFVVYGILQLINELMLLALLPISVGRFISYFESAPEEESEETNAYLNGGLIILCILVNAFISHSTAMGLMHISMKMAIACSSVIYRKSLMLSQTTLLQVTSGHIINLLSTDISHFEYGLLFVHYVWIAPLQLTLGIYLLHNIIGLAALLGISLHLLFIPLQIYFGKRKSELRLKTALQTDTRVNIMSEILQGIKIIKMYVWEKFFGRLISTARMSEVKLIRSCYYLEAITHTLEIVLPSLSIYLSTVAFIYLGNNIKASTVYSVIAIFDALRPTLTLMFSEGISNLAKVHITILRIQKLLSHDNLIPTQVSANCDKYVSPRITLHNVSAGWISEKKSDLTVKNVTVDIQNKQLIAIIGPVGSGKTSLIHVILKELPITYGSMKITGTISYASQIPWLFYASIRQNILFGNPYVEERYKQIIKICALETDLCNFPYGDRTIVGESGSNLSGGQKARINLARSIYKIADVYLLDDPLSSVDAKVAKQLFEECVKNFLCDKICILITHQIQYLQDVDIILILDEGKIIGNGNYNDLKSSGLNFAKLLPVEQAECVPNLPAANEEGCEYEQAYLSPLMYKEGMEQKTVAANIYFTYFKYGGNVCAIILLLSCFVASQICESGYYFFISYWVDVEQNFPKYNQSEENYVETERQTLIYIYSAIITFIIIFASTQSIFFFSFFMRVSVNIHNVIFRKVIDATMQFFNIIQSGVILNRFSDDLAELDEYIPMVLADALQISLQLVGVIIVTSIINYWFLLPSIGLLLFFLIIKSIYMKTSRCAKRIEAITRSSIFEHVSATLQGMATVRAFSAEDILQKEFDHFQDAHTSAWYLYISSNKAFTFWLDFICGIVASIIILSLYIYNTGYLGGDVGLVVNEFLSLMGVLQWGINQWSELENHMTSVERILEYNNIETEPVRKLTHTLPTDWPELGNIKFQNVSLSYNDSDKFTLQNLNFEINSKEKIGVVGRTGAGKSSIVTALFQLYKTKGAILIDNVDITMLPLEELRSKISIIPQEPFLFSGSVRKNLDPFEQHTDEVLWSALEKVQLKEDLLNTPLGLYCNVTEMGSNFSVGEKQLLCLARAIICNNKVLVLDEATANVDPHTDILIQDTIRKTFSNCTVITIAHRINSIIDSDKIMVMDFGNVVEFDHPFVLLQNSNGKFHSMVQATGNGNANSLYSIAEINYNNINK
ncbi:hypothetical protein FQA39_LY10101 [Lamprigera yunnana]|nr:hypothetical protein FQA39_LY10101 [Lamprigera yunnana]